MGDEERSLEGISGDDSLGLCLNTNWEWGRDAFFSFS